MCAEALAEPVRSAPEGWCALCQALPGLRCCPEGPHHSTSSLASQASGNRLSCPPVCTVRARLKPTLVGLIMIMIIIVLEEILLF